MNKNIRSGICITCEKENLFDIIPSNLLQLAQTLHFKTGEIVIEIDDIPESLYFLKKGCLRIYRLSLDSEIIVHNILPPMTFAEAIFFKQVPSKGRIISLEDSVILAIPAKTVFAYLKKQDMFLQFLISNLCTKIRTSQKKLLSFTSADSKIKLAQIIYMLYVDSNLKNDEVVITHDELAQTIGIHRVTVSRNLAKLQEEGIIVLKRNSIKIIDENKLIALIS